MIIVGVFLLLQCFTFTSRLIAIVYDSSILHASFNFYFITHHCFRNFVCLHIFATKCLLDLGGGFMTFTRKIPKDLALNKHCRARSCI